MKIFDTKKLTNIKTKILYLVIEKYFKQKYKSK